MDLVVSPSIVGFNPQSGGGHAPALTPGQLIDALVLQLIDDTTVRLSVAGSIIDVKTQVPLQPGSAVRLAVRGHGNETRLVIVGQGNEPPAASGDSAALRMPTVQAVTAQPADARAATTQDEVTLSSPLPQTEAPPTAPAAPARDLNPTAALANATRVAAARQTGLAPLFAQAAVAVQAESVPTPVRQAAAKLLLLQAPFEEGVTPQTVAKALSGSGLFLEARLAAVAREHLPPSAQEPATPSSSQTPSRPQVPVTAADIQGDIKAVLLSLREALKNWLDVSDAPAASRGGAVTDPLLRANDPQAAGVQGQTQAHAPAEEQAAIARALNADAKSAPPPLPYRNAPTTGQQPVAPAVADDAPAKLIGIALLDDTDGALARTTLMQAASLPSAPGIAADPTDVANTHWNLEVPFMTPQGTAIAHFEITRDGHKGTAAEQRVQGWRVNFSLDVEPMGPVHAQVSLTGHRAAVRLWAERSAAATALRGSVGELTDALRQASLEPSEVLVRDGAPPRPLKPGAGRFVDRAS